MAETEIPYNMRKDACKGFPVDSKEVRTTAALPHNPPA
jgi:hypothetical protein